MSSEDAAATLWQAEPCAPAAGRQASGAGPVLAGPRFRSTAAMPLKYQNRTPAAAAEQWPRPLRQGAR